MADGGRVEGPYVNGKKQGRWISRFADGAVKVRRCADDNCIPEQ